MKRFQYIIILLLFSSPVWSQNLTDALRLSDYRLHGTARATAMGNAFGALGGDFTSTSINPAGIGLYRSSEFVFSARLGETDIDATYLGMKTNESKTNFTVPNVGYVTTFNVPRSNGSSLVSINLGIGYNRMNDFKKKSLVYGEDATSSMLDGFIVNADNNSWNDYYEALAFDANLIYDGIKDPQTDEWIEEPDGFYEHDMQLYPNTNDFENYPHGQRKSFSQKGSVDEYVFSVAANFNHKVYVGATLGIQDVYFKDRTSLREYDPDNSIPYFNDYIFDTYLKTTGTGINAKFGVIVKPVDELRLGLAIHTPTYYDLDDDFYNDMYGSFEDGNTEALSQYGEYDYDLQTPMKVIFSAAYVIGKAGLVSIDYEWVDYSNMEFDADVDIDYINRTNEDIEEAFHSVGNLHIGGEYRVSEYFSLRGGFEYFPSPYKSHAFDVKQPNGDADTYTYSAGVGWKAGGFFADLAYKHVDSKNYINLYDVPVTANPANYTSPTAKFENNDDYLTLTLGFRF